MRSASSWWASNPGRQLHTRPFFKMRCDHIIYYKTKHWLSLHLVQLLWCFRDVLCGTCPLKTRGAFVFSQPVLLFLGTILFQKDMHLGHVNMWHLCVAAGCCSVENVFHIVSLSFVAAWFVHNLQPLRPLSEPAWLWQLNQMCVFHPKGKALTGQLTILV